MEIDMIQNRKTDFMSYFEVIIKKKQKIYEQLVFFCLDYLSCCCYIFLSFFLLNIFIFHSNSEFIYARIENTLCSREYVKKKSKTIN